VHTPGSPAFGEDDLELVSTFADQARWRCSAPKAVRRTRTAGVRRSGPDRPGSARARHRAVVRDRPDSARHSATGEVPGGGPRGSPGTSSTSTRSSPRSASVAITSRIGIVPADLTLHAQAVLREAVSNTVRHAHATELTVTVTVGNLGRCHGRGTHRLPLIVAIRSSSGYGDAPPGDERLDRERRRPGRRRSASPAGCFLPECVRDFSGTSCPECVKLLSGP